LSCGDDVELLYWLSGFYVDLASLLYLFKPFLLLLVLPPVPMLLLILIGAALLRRHQRSGRLLLGLGVLTLWLACTEGAGQWLALHAVHTPPALSPPAIAALRDEIQLTKQRHEKASVAVLVLGGGTWAWVPEYNGPGLKPLTLERLRFGIWLARQIDAPVAFSGGIGWGAKHQQESEAATAQRSATDEFKQPLIWVEDRSRDTRENAVLSLALLEANGIKKLLLVTDDLHMPRAQRAFIEAAKGRLEVITAPVGVRRDAMSAFSDWMPSHGGYARVGYAVYEWLGQKADR
jgi:uncharacterized SAM-binding protein YcdF (DUF218 family)